MMPLSLLFLCKKQIFTNADKIHALKVLAMLGLEDCFEGIICFETLNSTHKSTISDDEDDIDFVGSSAAAAATTSNGPEIFDIIGHFAEANPSSALPKTPIVCKPSEIAIERALQIANINPQRTVSSKLLQDIKSLSSLHISDHCLDCLQLFFEDSVRNIQAGKRVGLHTVLVSNLNQTENSEFIIQDPIELI